MRINICISVLLIGMILMTGCQPADDAEKVLGTEERTSSQIAFQLPERDFIPEGIAYDPVSGTFFLGSIRKSKIVRISRDGAVDTFVPPGHGGIWGVLGMRVDVERRVLWANGHTSSSMANHDPEATQLTGIFKYSLDDGSLIKSYILEKTEENHLFNDVAVVGDGSVFITSFSYGTIYKIDNVTDQLEEYLPMPDEAWTNGIDLTPDEKYLFVVGDQSIYRIDLANKEIHKLEVPEGDFVGYGDGLYFYNNSLVAITSGIVDEEPFNRVVRLHLSDDLATINRIEVLEKNHPLYVNPTTGAIVDGWFYYIATAQFSKFDADNNLAPWAELSDTIILKLKLD